MSIVAGVVITLLSTFVGERTAIAMYSDILGCENGCQVVATGWPLVSVRDIWACRSLIVLTY